MSSDVVLAKQRRIATNGPWLYAIYQEPVSNVIVWPGSWIACNWKQIDQKNIISRIFANRMKFDFKFSAKSIRINDKSSLESTLCARRSWTRFHQSMKEYPSIWNLKHDSNKIKLFNSNLHFLLVWTGNNKPRQWAAAHVHDNDAKLRWLCGKG